jgi:glycosyltransferase involved in cell wall biosynthesis
MGILEPMRLTSGEPRIAIVHDRLNVQGGGEVFLQELAALYPSAPIFTLIYDARLFAGTEIARHAVKPSFLSALPFAASHHRYYIPLMPWAIESLDLSEYDIVLSSSAAFAHGVRTHAGQLHISYIHCPMRYAWHQQEQHLDRFGFARPAVQALLAYLRTWDRRASRRANHMLANSAWTAGAVHSAFGREATVIYPPVQTARFAPAKVRADCYLTVSRLVPYKRVDLIAEAFAKLERPLWIVGEGPELTRIKRFAAPNIHFLGHQPPERVAELMAAARAFVFAAEEDFGIAAVEAQAAGCPVIAFGRGGLRETVVENQTGVFFPEQSVESLSEAIHRFEALESSFDNSVISEHARQFDVTNFRREFSAYLVTRWQDFVDQPSRS